MKRAPRILGWITGAFLGLCAVAAAALYVYFAEPHIAYREWRITAKPETIDVLYIFYFCGEKFPRLYEIASVDGNWSEPDERPTTVALADGLPSPEDTELALHGNVFSLTGYRYQAEERNIMTGATRSFPATRFDVVSWQVRTPYMEWVPSGDDGAVEQQERNNPVRYEMTGDDHDPGRFTPRHYVFCG